MSACICPLCDTSLAAGLAKLAKCQHIGHGPCLSAHVSKHGFCPFFNCAMPTTEDEVLLITHTEGKQSNSFAGLKDAKNVREVIDVILQRLPGLRQCAEAKDGELEKTADIFERLTENAPPGANGAEMAAARKSAWDELVAFLWKASPYILFVTFALICWYFVPSLVAGSATFEGISSLVMRLATALYSYIPEIVASGVAIFTTYVLGRKKKLCD
ncbi:hypothetical protein niasHT_029363 [Heterodera trifolii]|uniref:RING-type domain-containing protein n=1 Tax=Heterodera trifolii TaxID=157864 RepID=A0ABD2KM97_9BILA